MVHGRCMLQEGRGGHNGVKQLRREGSDNSQLSIPPLSWLASRSSRVTSQLLEG